MMSHLGGAATLIAPFMQFRDALKGCYCANVDVGSLGCAKFL